MLVYSKMRQLRTRLTRGQLVPEDIFTAFLINVCFSHLTSNVIKYGYRLLINTKTRNSSKNSII